MSIKIKSDEEIKDEARKIFREMMLRKPFAERWEPVSTELAWIIKGGPNEAEHRRILPDFCYNIFELYNRTVFKVLPTFSNTVTVIDKQLAASSKSVAEAKQCLTIDWEKFGVVLGIGIRSLRFFDVEVEEKLEQEGLLDLKEDQYEDLMKLFVGPNWLEIKTAEVQAQEPGKPVEEIAEKQLTAFEEYIKASIPKANQLAYQWGPEAITQLHQGIARGASGFVDDKGELYGERKLQLVETYGFLLIAWPEIQEMMEANPPKTRNDLWDWLTPFSHSKWIEIEDLDQLNRLCDSIKLKLKDPGPPRKVK
jgi:hypothetical protein